MVRRASAPVFMFSLPDTFSAVPRASCPVFLFCVPALVFGDNEDVGSRFYVLRSRIHFQQYRGRRVPFLCFARPNSFSVIPRALGPIFIFSAPGLVFDGIKGVGSRFHVLSARTHFRWYRGCRVPFFIFCAPELIFGCTYDISSSFLVLRSRTHFRWCRGRRVPFSSFALPNSFSAVPRASGPVFMIFPPGLIFGGSDGVR
jgi:hypothetical protein